LARSIVGVDMKKTAGKLAVVTGASRGLGRQIVLDLLADGYEVVGISRSLPDAHLSSNLFYTHVVADLAETDKIHEIVRAITRDHGTPDALVLNGAIGLGRPLGIMHESEVRLSLRVNLEANILLTKYFSRNMLSIRKGVILFVSSIAATDGFSNLAVYGATKAAIDSLAHSLAREFSGRGVRSLSLSPGFMETAMTSGYSEAEIAKIKRRTLNSDLVDVKAVSSAAVFLCSDQAFGLNGITIRADNGKMPAL
jgi:3-oxoacyl-[acyl-carrier protein] reductase